MKPHAETYHVGTSAVYLAHTQAPAMAVTPRAIARAAGKAAGQAFATAAQLQNVEAAAQAAIDAAAVAGSAFGTAEVAEVVAAISRDIAQGKFPGAEAGAAAVNVAAAGPAEPAQSLEGGTEVSRSRIQAAMPKQHPEEPKPWWSGLLGCKGQRWRVRSDCMMALMFVRSGVSKNDRLLFTLKRGDQCIQIERTQMYLCKHNKGKTASLKMRIEPEGWITLAMRGAENYGFLEKDDELEREDRTDEGHGLQWPGKTLTWVGQPDTDLVNAHLDPTHRGTCQYLGFGASHAPAAPLVPSSAFPSSAGAQSICWLIGHTPVPNQWSATDGSCCVCKKPLTPNGTGCSECPVKCCKDCRPPHPCRLGSLNNRICFSCQQPVIPGLETLSGCTLFCATCQHPCAAAAAKRESVAAAEVGMNQPARNVTAKRKADCAFDDAVSGMPCAEASPGAVPAPRLTGPLVLQPSTSVFPPEPPAAAPPMMQLPATCSSSSWVLCPKFNGNVKHVVLP